MTKNTGTPYEELAQQVFRAILAQDGITNIDVQHDIDLEGKTASHQIDVYWEFEQGGIRYRTVVQCKDWTSAVKQEQVFAFKTVLEDLPGQPRGIMVSRRGFQQGAREFASAHGIVLYELRQPKDSDWDGYLRQVDIHMELHVPVVHGFQLVPDVEWMRGEKQRLGLPDDPITVEFRSTLGEIIFHREDGSVLANAGDLVERVTPSKCERVTVEYRFDEPAFMNANHETVKRIKMLGFDVDIEDAIGMRQMLRIDANALVAFILKNVADNTFRSLDAQGRPLGPK